MAAVETRALVRVVVLTVALTLLFVPLGPVFSAAPEFLLPALVAYALLWPLVFRLATRQSLTHHALAAFGYRLHQPPRRSPAARVLAAACSVAAAVSLVLCVATLALWRRGHRVTDALRWEESVVLSVSPSRWVRVYEASGWVASRRGRLGYQQTGGVDVLPDYVLDKERRVDMTPRRRRWLTRQPLPPAYLLPPGAIGRPVPTAGPRTVWAELGVEYERQIAPARFEGEPPGRLTRLVVPAWMPALATALPPVVWMAVAAGRLRRVRPGLCPHCGYDLRATPGRCPECGAMPAADAPARA
jgi:hypothetical protein